MKVLITDNIAENGIELLRSQDDLTVDLRPGISQSDLLDAYQPTGGWEAPDQDATEEMWLTFERCTRKYWRTSCCLPEYPHGPPAFPGWKELGL